MAYVAPDVPPVGAAASEADKFIGVPDNYVTNYGGSAPISGAVQMRPDLYPVKVAPTYETDGPNTTGALQAIASLPPEAMARLQIRMARAGLIGPDTHVAVGVADDTTVGAYKELLGIANRYGMTDVDALNLLESKPGAAGATGASLSAGEQGPTTHTSTSTSTQKFTPLDAKSLADQAYQDALGQDASPKQRRALRAALNAYAGAHPSTSTSTTTTGVDGNSTTATTSTGGIDAAGVQQLATDQARSAPDYAEVQASTTYFQALQNALGATADVG